MTFEFEMATKIKQLEKQMRFVMGLESLAGNDSNLVHKTGDETIAGIKTFTSIPVLPASDPTSDNQAVRKKYIDLRAGIGGWIEIPDGSWSYASAATITVPSGAASIFSIGDQIRLKQGGAYKYYYVVGIADTVLTVTGGSDYSVANAAITDAAFSKGGGVGHPGYYNYTPTVTYVGGTTNPTSITTNFRFSINGKTLTVNGYGALTLGAGDRTFTIFTLPVTTTSICGVSATINYSTGGAVYKYTRLELDKIFVFHNTMNASDNYYLTAKCLIGGRK